MAYNQINTVCSCKHFS